MTAKPESGSGGTADGQPAEAEATKEDLQRRMDEARESISHTVGEIRDTVDDQYATVKATVSGVLDWREGFQKDPIVWSVGALSAGFALGYTLGVGQKKRGRAGSKASALATFADSLVEQLRTAGDHLPLPALNPQVRALFGFDLSDLLAQIGGATKAPRRRVPAKRKRVPRRKAGGRAVVTRRPGR